MWSTVRILPRDTCSGPLLQTPYSIASASIGQHPLNVRNHRFETFRQVFVKVRSRGSRIPPRAFHKILWCPRRAAAEEFEQRLEHPSQREGSDRLIPSRFIRKRSVEGLRPNATAAPEAPSITQLYPSRTRRISSAWTSSRLEATGAPFDAV